MEEAEPNKIIHLAFVRNGVVLDRSSATAYTLSLLAAELACNAIVIRNISGTYDGGEAQMGPGRGRQSETVLGYNHAIDFIDYEAVDNIAFYDDLAKNMAGYYFVYFTANLAWDVETTATLVPKSPVTDDNSTQIQLTNRITWRKDTHPRAFRVDTLSLDCCQALFDAEDAEFVNVSGSTAGVFGLEVEATVGNSVVVELNVPSGVKVDSATVVAPALLPAGLTLAVKPNGSGIRISGVPTAAGRVEVPLVVQNKCGVAATLDTVFVVS